MKRLNDWLAREAMRQARHPRLEHALLTDRAAGYVWYRLRLMWLRVLVRCAVHVLEVILLSSAMVPQEWLAVFIGYRTSTGLLSSLYWGVLEQMRQNVRVHMLRRHFGSARLEIHNWLRVSLVLGVLGVAAIGAWFAFAPSQYMGLSLFDLFGIACVLRLAFDLWARTLHSGIFATRRVYRPLWSLLLPEVVELALLIVLFPDFGLLAFLAMVVGGGVVRNGLSNHFSKRAYRGSRIDVPSFTEAIGARNALTAADVGSAAKLGLSNATSQLDGLIILLLLFVAPAGAQQGVTFASVYYVLRPLMGVAHGWARAFYFDFNRLDSGIALFQRRFRSLLTRTAIVLAAFVAVLVLVATALLSRGMPNAALLCLVPFFVARSLMSLRQLDAFTSGQHGALLRVSLLLLAALGVIAWLTRSEVVVMLAASALMLGAYWMLSVRASKPSEALVTGLPRFVARLHCATTPVRLSVLTIDRDVTTASRMVHRLSTVIEQGAIARFGRSHVLVLEPASASKLSSAREAALIGQGTIATYRSVQGDNGDAALQQAIERGVLPAPLAQMLNSDAHVNADLVSAYKAAHPDGTVIDATPGNVASGQTLKPRELYAVMHAIRVQARGGIERSSNKLDVMVYAPAGEPEIIFITPLVTRDQRPNITLRKQIQTATLRASLDVK